MTSFFARRTSDFPLAALLLGITGSCVVLAASAAAAANAGAAEQMLSIDPLTKYTLPDQTASVMLPEGWRVTHTGIAFIRAEGPKGELGFFGLVVPAHDGPAGSITAGTPLSQPYSADTGDKIGQSINWVRASNGQSPVQVNVISQQPFTAPAEFGQCSRVLMRLGVQNMGTLNSEADFCSLPADPSGNYRNFMKIVAAPPDVAIAQRGTLEAMLASYVLNMKAVQTQLAQRSADAAPSQNSGSQAADQPQPSQSSNSASTGSNGSTGQPAGTQQSAAAAKAVQATPAPVARSSAAAARGGSAYQNLQQKINAEIAQGGFSPQMVAAMRAQATAQANARMAPMLNQMRSFDQGINYFDRSVLREQIPVSITHAGTFWIDPN